MDDVRLIWSVRDAKTSLTTLLQKGQIGDELWERFLNAEKELEAEIVEVVGEANTFQAGYGQQIFAIASEMVSHERWKDMYEGIGKKREEEGTFPRSGETRRVFDLLLTPLPLLPTAARLASPLPSLALSPSSYLTPTSLTLAPSNPLSTSSLESAPLSLTSSTASTTPAPASLSPLLSSTVTSAPPSRESTPAPTSTTQSESKVTPVVSPAESVDGDEEDEEPASSGTKSPPLTPGGSKRKTPIKKKKVKGGK